MKLLRELRSLRLQLASRQLSRMRLTIFLQQLLRFDLELLRELRSLRLLLASRQLSRMRLTIFL
ncbi:MAG TPA: hypothetical protein VIA18_32925, partial [Polyangia bacterium]|nr:hypothetical protein [Polyangia bacterium]